MRFNPRVASRRILAIAIPAALVVAAVAFYQRPADDTTQRIASIETSIADVSELAERVQALESSGQSVEAQLAGLNEAIGGIQASLEDLSNRVGSNAQLAEKIDGVSGQVDSVSGKLSSLEQKISLLETRYNDHLRKYHGG